MKHFFAATILIFFAAFAGAQVIYYPGSYPEQDANRALGIVPSPLQPGEEVQVGLWTEKYNYFLNEDVTVCFRVSHDSYFFLYSTDSSGATRQIFPNSYDRNNFLQADVTYCIPDSTYRLVATPPVGREVLYGIATTYLYEWLGEPLAARDAQPFPSVKDRPETIYAEVQKRAAKEAEAHAEAGTTGPDAKPQAVPYRTVRPNQPEVARVVPAFGRAWQTIWILNAQSYRPPTVRPPYRTPLYDNPSVRPTPTPRPRNPYYGDGEWRSDPNREPYYVPNTPPPGYFPQTGEMGSIELKSSPDRADVFIDGVYMGRTPFTRELPAGRYDILVRKQGYRNYTRTVNVSEDAEESFSFRLQKL